MNSLFDELRRKIEKEGGQTGISAWELAQLPVAQRRVIRLVLREVQMAEPDLRRALDNLPPEQRLESSEVDEALAALLQKAWLIRLGQGLHSTYRVNLRHKRGSRLGASIWQRLEQRLDSMSPSADRR